MVVKMMKWRPWPPLSSKKFEAKITVHHLGGLFPSPQLQDSSRFSVEIKWKGSKGIGLGSLRRSVRRNFTKEELLGEDGVVHWGEEFRCICSFSTYKEGSFHPWKVSFAVFNGLKQGTNNNVPVVATASLNLSDFASAAEKQDGEVDVPLTIPCAHGDGCISLYLSISLLELRNAEDPPESTIPRPVIYFPRSPCYGEMFSLEKEDISTRKASPIRVNIFKGLSALRSKKEEGSDGRSSDRSEDVEFNYALDTDSLDDSDEGESDEVKQDSRVRKSFSYGTLAYANHAGGSIYSNTSSSEDEDWIYYSHGKSDGAHIYPGDKRIPVAEHSTQQNLKRRLLPWRKRKLSFRSPKVKGEPLLKKYYGEEGGDDIDFDRRQLSSSDESAIRKTGDNSAANQQYASEFGDDDFAIGIWELKEIISRDGHMKLKTQVFFASIDQRSERAAGESACTALVAVIADWLQSNQDEMPIKSQLDSLIREGSLEWRNLCENETYGERFADKHFDLETVLEAKVRPLSVVPEKSFIGFFHPEGLDDKGFDFLQGAMSFDNIWEEICRCASEMQPCSDPLVYIISWNDHFFVLKVEHDAYYIIDTLGERLYEGCNQAFILKFDRDTMIHQVASETQNSDDKPANDKPEKNRKIEVSTGKEVVAVNDSPGKNEEDSMIVCTGKESCKEYIKSFLAAIPIRELQVDLKKGLMASTPLHHRLQIEFHYTQRLNPVGQHPIAEAVDDTQATLALTQLEPDEL
ncbi:uncharacterized protein LOC105161020 isoform X2 [Sesamum indicum]|uniref:Uncharacterized protein LOC105161020 isoform X2 n=1 Tax=Sesamum indicum TaxID=4182 RepID=A0A6I9T1X9_SESIN|nr:uncharacterized protein LOC105161020 isoform X2 [Sesamum indicum]